MAGIFTRVKSEPKFDNTYLAAKKQIYKFQLEQLLRTLRSACSFVRDTLRINVLYSLELFRHIKERTNSRKEMA